MPSKAFFSVIFLASLLGVQGQPPAPVAPAVATAVPLDIGKRTLGEVPFDKAFYFTGEVKPEWNVKTILCEMAHGHNLTKAVFVKITQATISANNQFVLPYISKKTAFTKDFLLPDRTYTLKITALDKDGRAIPEYSFTYGIVTSSKFGDHAKLDFGVGYAPKPQASFGATTVNLYLTPINEETDLRDISDWKRNLLLRVGFYAGIAPILFSSDTEQPLKNRFAVGNFVYGIGIRSPFYGWHNVFKNRVGQKLLQPMRLKAGWFLFKQSDANPLITAERSKRAPYVGISYDINIASLLGPIGKIVQL